MTKAFKKAEQKAPLVIQDMSNAQGFEEMNGDSFIIPMLNIVQPLTPIYKSETKDSSIKLGAIYDNVSQMGYKTVRVIPVMFRQRWLEWKPRIAGGGLVAIHETCPSNLTQVEKKWVNSTGNNIVDTRQHYVVFLDSNDLYSPALISMKSTGVKISRGWCTQMKMTRIKDIDKNGVTIVRNVPMYGRYYELSTTLVQKNSDEWHQWVFRMLPEPVEGYALEEATKFYNLLRTTDTVDVKATYNAATETAASTDEPAY